MEGLNSELNIIANSNLSSPEIYFELEKLVMLRTIEYIEKFKICCYSGRSGLRSITNFNPDSLIIKVTVNNGCELFKEQEVALIDQYPIMPEIGFKIEYNSEEVFCTEFIAQLKIYYGRSDSNYVSRSRNDSLIIEIDQVYLDQYYNIEYGDIIINGKLRPKIQGGRAKIVINDLTGSPIKEFKFSVKGINPKAREVFDYCDSNTEFNDLWYLKKVLCHETGSLPQTLNSYMKHFNHKRMDKEDIWASYENFSRCPNMSFDLGWGLGQLTNPRPKSQELWDWKSNIDGTYNLFVTKRNEIANTINNYLAIISSWENSNPDSSIISGHSNFAHDSITYVHGMSNFFTNLINNSNHFNVVVQNGQQSFQDAMLLKYYNGIGIKESPFFDKHFYYLKYNQSTPSIRPKWEIDIDGHYWDKKNQQYKTNYYVRYISNYHIPTH